MSSCALRVLNAIGSFLGGGGMKKKQILGLEIRAARSMYVRVDEWLWNSIGYDGVKSWLFFFLNA